MPHKFSEIINQLPAFKEAVESRIETLIANLVMIGEIAAPTFSEEMRVSFFKQRFSECGMQDVSGDQTGNGLAVLHGEAKHQGGQAHKCVLIGGGLDAQIQFSIGARDPLDLLAASGESPQGGQEERGGFPCDPDHG